MALSEQHEEFARLVASHQREIQSYIFANVVNWGDADEIWQETCVRLWLEFEKFEPESNFVAWAIRVAYYEILTWRTKAGRNKLVFDQSFIDDIAVEQTYVASSENQDRLKALDECLQQLSDRKRRIIGQFYTPHKEVQDIASVMNCSVGVIYKAVQRIRSDLRRCIELRLQKEGRA
ncbi:sigma-70 family RNA polymerase sigma factor [Adhaeretor mobilis]|uniref:RNA polymerase sigma factor n=1 Tax=Adhaeretor mobilis TaxID=1930276 RepID=A0A517MYJ0_9BACT|nr:sigma-70 family RNA polymerase sigma factor [Adhaeretor mobilis]QDS99945.1 RNA polymerase sigma factor [Adhaeretor mobilis]